MRLPLLTLPLCLVLAAPVARAVTVLESRVPSSSDDAEEAVSTGTVSLDSLDLELIREGSTDQLVGLRFPNQSIPADATVTNAWIQFEASAPSSTAAALHLRADRTQASPAFTPALGNVSLRPRTAGAVDWAPPAWSSAGEATAAERTPSLASIVQERVSATDWQPGDPLSFIVTGQGSRSAAAWDGSPSAAPLLHVEFDPPANHQPVIAIVTPLQGTTVFQGTSVAFSASATDLESGDVSPSLTWISSLDGILGIGASFSRSDLTVGAHTITVTASDGQGGFSARTLRVTVFAPSDQILAAGDVGSCSSTGDEATGALLETLSGTILGVGDLAYPSGSAADFQSCFEPAWGRHQARIRPVPGPVEYQQPSATPYFDTFGNVAGVRSQGYYSFDVGDWHVIALNSQCDQIGGCDAGSPEEYMIQADLAANGKPCTLAFLHDPRFSSGTAGVDDRTLGLWQALYDWGVDVIVQGGDHAYERFARQSPAGVAEPLRGIRSFVVGTGGGGAFQSAVESEPNSEVRDETTYGVLRLALQPTGYSWEFVGAGPGTFTDSGSEECITGNPVVTITSPASGSIFNYGETVPLRGTALDPQEGSLDSQIVWSSTKDGFLGTGPSLDVTSLSTGSHHLWARVVDSTGLTGGFKVSVNISAPAGSGGGCGMGPELAPALALLLGLRARQRRSSRARAKRSQ